MLFAIPSGGKRHIITAVRLKAEGVRAGIPDLMLAVPRGRWHGLFIELKVGRRKPTVQQKIWITKLRQQGYWVEVCWGFEQAKEAILEYLRAGE